MDKNIKMSKFLIADGNPTLLVWGSLADQKNELISKYLSSVDQIGFISNNALEMMGSELCINAALAFASTLSKNGSLIINPLNSPIQFSNTDQFTSMQLPLNYKKMGNIVLLDGIGFKFEDLNYRVTKSELKSLASTYNLPAFGIILYQDNQIFPYVYVKETDSFKQESACGSGSISTTIFTGITDIKQPTGQMIKVDLMDNIVEITSKVKEVKF